MLQIGPGLNPTHAGPIGHMVLMDKPNELRVGYIGQVDLISLMTPIHLKPEKNLNFPMCHSLFLFNLICSGVNFPVILNICMPPVVLRNFTGT